MFTPRIPEYQEDVFMQEFIKCLDTDFLDFKQDPFCQKYLPGKKSLLEVPCGTGQGAYSLARSFSGLKVTGIDIYRPCIEFAKKNFDWDHNFLTFKVGDIYDLTGEKAEVVRTVLSLHHLDNLKRAFSSVREALPSNGTFVIGDLDRNQNNENPILHFWAEKRKEWGEKYISMFTQDEIVAAGIKIDRPTALYLDSRIASYTLPEVEEALHQTGFHINFCQNYLETFGLIAVKK